MATQYGFWPIGILPQSESANLDAIPQSGFSLPMSATEICNQLPGRLRDICSGTSGLPESKRATYIANWIADGRLPADAFDQLGVAPLTVTQAEVSGPQKSGKKPERREDCVHRGQQTRTVECTCPSGNVNLLPVYHCDMYGECLSGRTKLGLVGCKSCDQYLPPAI